MRVLGTYEIMKLFRFERKVLNLEVSGTVPVLGFDNLNSDCKSST